MRFIKRWNQQYNIVKKQKLFIILFSLKNQYKNILDLPYKTYLLQNKKRSALWISKCIKKLQFYICFFKPLKTYLCALL